jgi:hypothetical protein
VRRQRRRRSNENLDTYLHAMEATRAFLSRETVQTDPHGILRELALGFYDEVTEKAAEAAHGLRVAEFLAERRPNDAGPESAVMREYGAHLHVRSDTIQGAFTALIDEGELTETERLVTIAAVKEASGRVNEEYEKFRREQGLCG